MGILIETFFSFLSIYNLRESFIHFFRFQWNSSINHWYNVISIFWQDGLKILKTSPLVRISLSECPALGWLTFEATTEAILSCRDIPTETRQTDAPSSQAGRDWWGFFPCSLPLTFQPTNNSTMESRGVFCQSYECYSMSPMTSS